MLITRSRTRCGIPFPPCSDGTGRLLWEVGLPSSLSKPNFFFLIWQGQPPCELPMWWMNCYQHPLEVPQAPLMSQYMKAIVVRGSTANSGKKYQLDGESRFRAHLASRSATPQLQWDLQACILKGYCPPAPPPSSDRLTRLRQSLEPTKGAPSALPFQLPAKFLFCFLFVLFVRFFLGRNAPGGVLTKQQVQLDFEINAPRATSPTLGDRIQDQQKGSTQLTI